jgi:hypothetical protein
MAITMLPAHTTTPSKKVATDSETKPLSNTPRPAAVRLGKAQPTKAQPTKDRRIVTAKPATAIQNKAVTAHNKHKALVAHTGTKRTGSVKSTTLHSDPKKMPVVHSTLSKPSTAAKSLTLSKTVTPAKKSAAAKTAAPAKKTVASDLHY